MHLADVATIRRDVLEAQSAYHGNGNPAIAVNIQRATTGHALNTIADVTALLPNCEKTYPGIDFTIPDTQGDLINLSVGNMLGALRDAVIMTIIVIFLFLADLRGMLLAAIGIPFTYLLTFAAMWLIGYEFNMVTLTAVIIAVGMLLDDAIVVLENIERHYHEKAPTCAKPWSAAPRRSCWPSSPAPTPRSWCCCRSSSSVASSRRCCAPCRSALSLPWPLRTWSRSR